MSILRGEVYFVNLDPGLGREQRGTRPVVVVSRDDINALPLVVTVVPGTGGRHVPTDYAWNARIPAGEGNLPQETVFLAFQARALDQSRFPDTPVGIVTSAAMAEIDRALAWSLFLPSSGSVP